mmetsp:Transcript_75697/g.182996  ORF Transcript_75697/g.182996 Transcript_75697/m.182996 type:complete len:219 (+) Transcript_75697:332-988(+)
MKGNNHPRTLKVIDASWRQWSIPARDASLHGPRGVHRATLHPGLCRQLRIQQAHNTEVALRPAIPHCLRNSTPRHDQLNVIDCTLPAASGKVDGDGARGSTYLHGIALEEAQGVHHAAAEAQERVLHSQEVGPADLQERVVRGDVQESSARRLEVRPPLGAQLPPGGVLRAEDGGNSGPAALVRVVQSSHALHVDGLLHLRGGRQHALDCGGVALHRS